jgi:hypothetical protein
MWIVDFLAPRSCVFCGISSEKEEKDICRACYADPPWNEPALSPVKSDLESSIAILCRSFPVLCGENRRPFNRG